MFLFGYLLSRSSLFKWWKGCVTNCQEKPKQNNSALYSEGREVKALKTSRLGKASQAVEHWLHLTTTLCLWHARAKLLTKIWCCAWPELCILKFPRSNRTIWQRNLSVLTRQFSTILVIHVIQEFQAKKSVKCLRKEISNQTLFGYLVK